MKKLSSAFAFVLLGATLALLPAKAALFTDTTGDIDPGIANAGGTLDILSMEVSHTSNDITFTLTLNGNLNSPTDWGNFMIGIATGGAGTTTGNGWGRPINLNSPIGGMDYWVGSWVNAGGGSQLWGYDGVEWNLQVPALPGFSIVAGTTSTITTTTTLASLGLSLGDTFYFDAFSTGGGGTDSAVDSLSNPNVSITGWGDPYTANLTNGISSYTVVPEPATSAALLALASLAVIGLRRRPRS